VDNPRKLLVSYEIIKGKLEESLRKAIIAVID